MSNKDLRLLALDGGGVRGLSALIILQQLMEIIDPEAPPKPCEYFDMIGGTSTGGLIAVMLGRLRMSIDECIDSYLLLSDRIFQKKRHRVTIKGNIQGRFDSEELAQAIKEVVTGKGLQEDTLLKDVSGDMCKIFVCATSKQTTETVCLASYKSPRGGSDLLNSVKIWEACRATSAASSFFDSIAVGRYGEEFIDGATGANNPVWEMWNQAQLMWGPEPLESRIKCLVSIGTGVPSLKPFQDDVFAIGKTLIAIATETEQTAERFRRDKSQLDNSGRYYRFNVDRGLEDIGLEESKKRKEIAAATRRYVGSQGVFKQMQACADNMAGRAYLGEYQSPFKGQYQFAITLGDYSTHVPNSLIFTENTIVEEITCSHDPFWSGRIRSQRGIFPRGMVRVIEDSAAEGYGWRSTKNLHDASLYDPDLTACLLRTEEPLYVNLTGHIHDDALYTAVNEPNVRVVQFLDDYKDFDFEEALLRPGPNGTALGCAVLGYSKQSYPPDIVEIVLRRLSSTLSLEMYVERKQPMPIYSILGLTDWENENPINDPSAHCQRLLLYASSRGHLDLVKLLIGRKEVDINSPTWWSQTAVSRAAEAGHLAVVKLLSEVEKIELDTPNKNGRTPLSLAAGKGKTEVVQFLADRDGVDVNSESNESDQNPIYYALRGGHDEVVELLLAHHKTKLDLADFLTAAAYEGRDKIVSKLVARNDVEKDKKDRNGCTPLIKAAQNGQTAVVKILVERDDVKADETSNTGQTALSWAAEKGHLAVVKLLADRSDVDVNASDNARQTPLMWAARNGREHVVRYLLLRNDVERDPSRGFTASPLAKAAKNGHFFSAFRLGLDKVRKQL